MAVGALGLSAGSPAEVTSARRAVEVRLREWGCDLLDEVLLVFSELVTNAVSHAGRAERVLVRLDEAAVTVAVEDASGSGPQMRLEGDASGGFGLRIVEQLAIEWGWEPTDIGKRVWAKVRCFD